MKKYFHAYAMCRSMFCAVPSPWRVWEEESRPLMLLFLPVLGLELGAVWLFLLWAVRRLALPAPVAGFVLCAWPFLSTGSMHLDGFMDVTDAIRSCRSAERRREILKDPHVGSFAVVGAALLLLAEFALFSSVPEGKNGLALLFIPAVSRCGSALSVPLLRPMGGSQYAAQAIRKRQAAVPGVLLALLLAAGFAFCGREGFALLGGAAGYALALRRGFRALDGMNGDIAGYALTLSELCAAAVWVLI